ncbi:hypothetical protein BGW80DRAFT_1322638 [Lactifluus volemus]|nr:hypothetical protein BGW80DRAFT_1322638 [Lactifluus volemus]
MMRDMTDCIYSTGREDVLVQQGKQRDKHMQEGDVAGKRQVKARKRKYRMKEAKCKTGSGDGG